MTASYPSMPNEELYERCRAGDEMSWAYVYRFVLTICRCTRWRLGSQAEDVAQHIIEFLLEKGIQKVEHPRYFRIFLKKVAVNKIKDSYKRKEAKYEICVEDEILEIRKNASNPSSCNPGPETALMQKELVAAVSRELLGLPDFCRKVMPGYFSYKAGIIGSYSELSDLLDMPAGTISSYVYRCLKKLQESKALRTFL